MTDSKGAQTLASVFRTPGVKNIENAFSRGGGTKTHTPAIATKRGDSEHVTGGAANQDQKQGIDSTSFQNKFGDQKPKPGLMGKAYNTFVYGSENGKP
ncbi:MAG: hypothetical protein M1817_004429 [Caeruleum heppii]|nr:MAG: hypothetical protein M1817_004429 [Caeruleum heppii]